MMDIQKAIEGLSCAASSSASKNWRYTPHVNAVLAHIAELQERAEKVEAQLAAARGVKKIWQDRAWTAEEKLAKQEVSGWRAVENDNRDLREPLYLDGSNEPAGWSSDYEPLYARAAPPAPVKLPVCVDDLHGIGPVMSADEVVEAIKAAGAEVADE